MANGSTAAAAGQRRVPPVRPEFVNGPLSVDTAAVVPHPLTVWERLTNIDALRRIAVLVVFIASWEAYATWVNNPLMFPSVTDTVKALLDATLRGPLLDRIWASLKVLSMGYGIGIALAAAFTALAVSVRIGNDILATLTSMFNPLPAIALLPLALQWFGLGTPSLVFVIIHSVLWPVALNTHSGFLSVSETQRLAGQNYGLRGLRYVALILIPAAFPSILTGLKIGWAFAWRTLIAAELVFGVSSRSGGLGWFIFEKRNQLETDYVFAGLLCVILIGLIVESLIFRFIEARTVRKWGMQR